MTCLSNGWASNEKKICTHNSLQLSTTFGHRMSLLGVHVTEVWPNVNLTWSLSWGGVHLTIGQPDLKTWQPDLKPHLQGGTSDQGWAWPKDLTKISTWSKASPMVGVQGCLTKGEPDLEIWQKCHPDLKPHLQQRYIWPRSAWPKDLTKMSTWPITSPMGVHLTKCKKDIWKFEHTLLFQCCFTEVFSTKDQ